MFQFNFSPADSYEETPEKVGNSHQWLPAQKHEPSAAQIEAILDECGIEETTVGQTKIRYVNMESAAKRMQREGTSQFISHILGDHTDLVPAVYEGGLKIWECTWDLLRYLAASDLQFNRKRVLEVGCGAALPALFCALQGSHITLQDYNQEVVEQVTIPNVAVNLCAAPFNGPASPSTPIDLATLSSSATFYSGDWGGFVRLLSSQTEITVQEEKRGKYQEQKFDFILTSETIYNPECHQKLLDLLTSCLQEDGLILLAAKSHYFGVGGGTLQFINLVRQKGQLDVKTHTTNTEGVKREILVMKFKARKNENVY